MKAQLPGKIQKGINRYAYATVSRNIKKTAAEKLNKTDMMMITGTVPLPVIIMRMTVGMSMRRSGFVP
jgi:hypothetical protein